jgi:predicted nucleotidyltransferase
MAMSEAAKPTPEAVRELAAKLVPVLLRYGVVRAGVFGSVARGEAGPESDLDLLVEYRQEPRMTLRDLVDLYEELSHLAGRRVELCEYHLLKPRIRDRVLDEQVHIL